MSVSGIALSGTDAANYTANTTAAATADITARGLTVSGITAADKVYDATTTATINADSATLAGVLSGDTVTLAAASATGAFATKNAGTGKVVNVSGSEPERGRCGQLHPHSTHYDCQHHPGGAHRHGRQQDPRRRPGQSDLDRQLFGLRRRGNACHQRRHRLSRAEHHHHQRRRHLSDHRRPGHLERRQLLLQLRQRRIDGDRSAPPAD